MRKRKSPVARSLLLNSKSAILAAIEIHNKPLFPYRYEVSVLLVINAWELLLKAYIYKFLKGVRLFLRDGMTKPFRDCVSCVANNLGKEFQAMEESLSLLYKYRNSVAHFYSENLDLVLYSLLKANVAFYVEFINNHFHLDLSKETNLILLPIGFSKPYSPIDFLYNNSSLVSAPEEVRNFIQGIVESSQRLQAAGIEDSILVEFKMSLVNEKRIKNADLVAAINNTETQSNVIAIQNSLDNIRITTNPNAKEYRVSEDDLYGKVFTETHAVVVDEARRRFTDFLQNKKFNGLMAQFREDKTLFRPRYLDPTNPKSLKKDFYSKGVYDELAKHYCLRDSTSQK